MRRGGLVTIAAAFVLAAPAPAAVAVARQTVSFAFTTTRPGAPTGEDLAVDFQDPANPDGKPYALARMVVELPAGAVIDTSAPVQCHASDAELELEGAAACPAASRVGGGEIVSDTGSTGSFPPRFVHNVANLFNNAGELIGVADAADQPVVPGITRTVNRSPITGTTTTSDFPAFPGNPPPDDFTAVRTLRLSGDPVVRDGRAYTRTPPTCPRSRAWTVRLTFVYQDGVSQTVLAHPRCDGR